MPYDPQTGLWKPEDDTLTNRVGMLTAADSPLMKDARKRGLQAAQARGLTNSSIATRAGEAAALNVAVPIAAQESADVARKNLQAQEFAQTGVLAAGEQASRERISGAELGTRRDIAAQEIGLRRDLSAAELASQERRVAADADTRVRIAQMNITANDREKAAGLVGTFEQAYQQAFHQIAQNENLPQPARDRYLNHLAAVRDTNFNLIEQLYGIDLRWTTPSVGSPPNPNSPPPPPPPSGGGNNAVMVQDQP